MRETLSPVVSATTCALLALAAWQADAQSRPAGGVPRTVIPSSQGPIRGMIIVEREVERIVEVPVEAPPPPAAVPLPQESGRGDKPAAPETPPPREPYVIGKSYSSLPGGCMKLIEELVAYYYCDGDWYRQQGSQYQAVAKR
jgi:hypothetical protein